MRSGSFRTNAVLVVLGLAAGLVLAEGALRLLAPQPVGEAARVAEFGTESLTRYDPELGWKNTPGARAVFGPGAAGLSFSINGAGFRDVAHDENAAPGTYRVAVLGDSFVFGSGVSQESTLTAQLATRLGAGFEVLNFGVPGYGTDQEYLSLRVAGPRYRPKLVLLGFFWNDLMENASSECYGMRKPRFELRSRELRLVETASGGGPVLSRSRRLDQALGQRSHIYVLFRRGFSGLGQTVRDLELLWSKRPEEPPVWLGFALSHVTGTRQQELDLTVALLREIRKLCRDHGADFAVFTVPPRFLVDDDVKARVLAAAHLPEDAMAPEPFGLLREACARESITVVDLLPRFRRAHREGQSLFLPSGIHWSAAGHALAAEALAEAVRVPREGR